LVSNATLPARLSSGKKSEHMKPFYFTLLSITSTVFSCKENKPVEPGSITFNGLLQEQGITTYQYGSHTITNGTLGYALTSETIDLGPYVGDTVTIKGLKKEGYPVEDGPDFIEVTTITP
jgi:hypothetical protein